MLGNPFDSLAVTGREETCYSQFSLPSTEYRIGTAELFISVFEDEFVHTLPATSIQFYLIVAKALSLSFS